MSTYNYPPIGRYINPLVDFAFKKIFGSEPNKDLLIAFLNEVFEGRKVIADLIYNKNEHPGDSAYEGGAIFDLMCTGDKGEQFLIEVQRGTQLYFKERALFYTSRLISSQAPKGGLQKWAYELKEVYLIALLENTQLPGTTATTYLHQVALCNRNTGQLFYDKLEYTYIELSKFTKAETELVSDLDKWLYVLKHLSKMDKLPVYLRKPIFEKLFQIAEYTNLSKEEQAMYDSSLKYKWDNDNVREYEIKLAREDAKKEEDYTIAREMKKDSIPYEQISRYTKLSIEEIEKL